MEFTRALIFAFVFAFVALVGILAFYTLTFYIGFGGTYFIIFIILLILALSVPDNFNRYHSHNCSCFNH